jgi:poly(A) polymerase Pap1
MEYQYHPVIKHVTYFILIYLFLRHQKIMANDILLINSIILTLFVIILDHLFIDNHPSPFESSYNYIDEDEVKKLKKKIKKEKRKNKKSDDKLINELSSKEEIDKHINRILDEEDDIKVQSKSHEEVSDNYRNRIISQQNQQQKENFEDFIGNLDNIETFNPSRTSFNNNSNDIEPFNVLGYNE